MLLGLSSEEYAAYQAGQRSDEDAAQTGRIVRSLFRPKVPTVDVNQLIANNQALAAENARLRQELEDYKLNYHRMKEWARQVEPFLDTFRDSGQ